MASDSTEQQVVDEGDKYFFLQHKGRTNALKNATKEELEAIQGLFIDDVKKKLFRLIVLDDKVWTRVKSFYTKAVSNPSAEISPTAIMKKYFRQFNHTKNYRDEAGL